MSGEESETTTVEKHPNWSENDKFQFKIEKLKANLFLLKIKGKAGSGDAKKILRSIEKNISTKSLAHLIIDLDGFQKFPLSDRKIVFESFWKYNTEKRIAFSYLLNANTFIKSIATLIGAFYKGGHFDYVKSLNEAISKFESKKEENSNQTEQIERAIQEKKSNDFIKITHTQTFESKSNPGSSLICSIIEPNIVLYEYYGTIDMDLAKNYVPFAENAYKQIGKFHFIVDLKNSTKVTKEVREYYNSVNEGFLPMVHWNYYNLTSLFSVLYKIYALINPSFIKHVKVIQSVPECIKNIHSNTEVKDLIKHKKNSQNYLSNEELKNLDKESLIQYINVLQSEMDYQQNQSKIRSEEMFEILSKITWSGNFDHINLPEIHESDDFYNVYKSIELLKHDVGDLIEELKSTNQNLEALVEKRSKVIIYKESNLRAIIENFQSPVWLIDKKYRVLEFNGLFKENMLKHYNINLEKGDDILANFPDKLLKEWKERYDLCLKGESKNYFESYDFPGGKKYFEIKTFPIYAKNEIHGVGIVAIDISDLQNSKEKLEDQNVKLSKLNNELDSFIYRSSHDLRAPISSVKGLIEISKMEEDPAIKLQYLEMMGSTMDKLDGFIHEIVDITKNEKLELKFEDCKLYDLFDTILEELGHKESINKIRIENRIDKKFIIKSDKNRLKTLFKNIIANSIKYRDEKKESYIHISSSLNKHKIIVEIEDNGLGIKKKYLPKLTGMFYRAHPEKSGSGLGLYIVKEILTKLKGELELESEYGKFTKTRVSFKK
ncbi:PAS domain-containing sensor histidine kinase [Hyphobacterium sp. CCMP332]|nr:PAS domain-containing sensor histidine kinase [Hyphobacterium sp. CCMP332]